MIEPTAAHVPAGLPETSAGDSGSPAGSPTGFPARRHSSESDVRAAHRRPSSDPGTVARDADSTADLAAVDLATQRGGVASADPGGMDAERSDDTSFFELLDKLQRSRIDGQRSRALPFDRPMVVKADVETAGRQRRASVPNKQAVDRLCMYYSDKRTDQHHVEWPEEVPPGYGPVESGLLVAGSEGYTTVEPVARVDQSTETVIAGVAIRDSASPTLRPSLEVVSADPDAGFYRANFVNHDHLNFVGNLADGSPVAVSLRRRQVENTERDAGHTYLMVARFAGRGATIRLEIAEDRIPPSKDRGASRTSSEVLGFLLPDVPTKVLRQAKVDGALPDKLTKLDECHVNGAQEYKVGILHCLPGQTNEDAMYNNNSGSPELRKFLGAIATRVRLKGFPGFRGGLDVTTGHTGTHSYAASHKGTNIMFHVAPMLPFEENNPQQVTRKRHLGNDLVCVVFQEPGSAPLDPTWFHSKFQKVFVVVQPRDPPADGSLGHDPDAPSEYLVSVARQSAIPPFGPLLDTAVMSSSAVAGGVFRELVLSLVVNAENACHRSSGLRLYSDRVRTQLLDDIVTSYVTEVPVDGTRNRIAQLFPSSGRKAVLRSAKKKLLSSELPKGYGEHATRWLVQKVQPGRSEPVDVVLVISSQIIVLIDAIGGSTLHHLPILSVFGWTLRDDGLDVVMRKSGQVLELLCEPDETRTIHRALALHSRGGTLTDVSIVRPDPSVPWGVTLDRVGTVVQVVPDSPADEANLAVGSAVKMVNMTFAGAGPASGSATEGADTGVGATAVALIDAADGNVLHLKVFALSRKKRSSLQDSQHNNDGALGAGAAPVTSASEAVGPPPMVLGSVRAASEASLAGILPSKLQYDEIDDARRLSSGAPQPSALEKGRTLSAPEDAVTESHPRAPAVSAEDPNNRPPPTDDANEGETAAGHPSSQESQAAGAPANLGTGAAARSSATPEPSTSQKETSGKQRGAAPKRGSGGAVGAGVVRSPRASSAKVKDKGGEGMSKGPSRGRPSSLTARKSGGSVEDTGPRATSRSAVLAARKSRENAANGGDNKPAPASSRPTSASSSAAGGVGTNRRHRTSGSGITGGRPGSRGAGVAATAARKSRDAGGPKNVAFGSRVPPPRSSDPKPSAGSGAVGKGRRSTAATTAAATVTRTSATKGAAAASKNGGRVKVAKAAAATSQQPGRRMGRSQGKQDSGSARELQPQDVDVEYEV